MTRNIRINYCTKQAPWPLCQETGGSRASVGMEGQPALCSSQLQQNTWDGKVRPVEGTIQAFQTALCQEVETKISKHLVTMLTVKDGQSAPSFSEDGSEVQISDVIKY